MAVQAVQSAMQTFESVTPQGFPLHGHLHGQVLFLHGLHGQMIHSTFTSASTAVPLSLNSQ